MNAWFNIKPKTSEKHAPCYASLGGKVDGVQYVRLTNGAYVCFTLTQEECRQRYNLGSKCSEERSKQIEDRFQWEINR